MLNDEKLKARVELLEQAVARLEELKAGASGLPWAATRYAVVGDLADGDHSEIICGSVGSIGNAALIAALSRTVDPMLKMLREGIREVYRSGTCPTDVAYAAIGLAEAILGVNDD